MSAKQKITIYSFGGSAVISSSKNPEKKIVGGKGLGLQVMTKIGVDVPPGGYCFIDHFL